jgi:hypothetical protein
LTQIAQWIDESDKRVFWLNGVAGMGKSTVAHHVAGVLSQTDQLAACFFFKQAQDSQNTLEFVLGSIAYQLARTDPDVKAAICQAILRFPNYTTAENRFQTLIVEPLIAGSFDRSLVMIFDGLDEWSSSSHFLDILLRCLPLLPSTVKLLISSRHQPDISERVGKLPSVVVDLRGGTVDEMRVFFDKELGAIATRRNLSDWPMSKQMDDLVYRSEGLFIWASTVCRFIGQTQGQKLQVLLEAVISYASKRHAESALNALYLATLHHLFPKDLCNHLMIENLQLVLSLIIMYHYSLRNLQVFLLDIDVGDIVSHLCCILVVQEPEGSVLLHRSMSRLWE